ncbi:MAG: FAD-binding protein [Thermomicrobiales bacterium]|nr:FAD-binding protein [Thermomicrobiales bacterium]
MTAPTANIWTNWAHNVDVRPRSIERPATIDELRRIVRDAARRGDEIRAVGSGHSFAPLCSTSGVLLDLSLLHGIEAVDPATGEAIVLAGTKLHALGEPLFAAGRALANQGDIDRQALGGVISTGTHGTGRVAGSFSAQVTRLELVTAEGDLLTIDARDGERFRAARLALGAFGILTRATIATVPAYKLHERTRALPFEETLAEFAETEPGVRNAEFWWAPKHDVGVLKTLEETDAAPLPREAREYPPGTVERYLKPEIIDWSWRVYPNERDTPFVELEYTLPLATAPLAMRELRDMMRTRYPACIWAVEYRTQPGEDALLSPTAGRDSATISVHQAVGQPWDRFFRDAEAIFLAHDGRPHWGKLQFLSAEAIGNLYPERPLFERVRKELDPKGVFLSDCLRGFGFGS